MRRLILCALAAAFPALLACGAARRSEVAPRMADGARADTSATKASLLAADEALARAVSARGAAAFFDALAPGTPVLFPGQPILRDDDVRAPFLARYGGASSYAWRAAHAVASADGHFGCTVGFSRFTHAADSARAERPGAYVTCWRRGNDGHWRVTGHQRNDSFARAPVDAAGATLARAPHSAVWAQARDPRAEAQTADATFAAMGALPEGPGPAFARFAADDGMLLGGARLPRGPAQIRAAFDGFPADRVLRWEPRRDAGDGGGGLAFTVGHSVNEPREGKTGPRLPGKYLTVWREEPEGRWAFIFDLGSERP